MRRKAAEWRRFRLTIAYEGSGFAGWQSQPAGNTVQDELDRAVRATCSEASGVQGSGRTDAGVHALGQVAHFDAPVALRMDGAAWRRALNAKLPRAVRILECRPVSMDFHARFSATGKIYRYEWFTGAVLSPFRAGRVWHVHRTPDEAVVRQVASLFEGTHDFAGFAANRGEPEEAKPGTVRRIDRVTVMREGPDWAAQFEGEGFLYKMVRMLVGAMVRCGQGSCRVEDVRERLERPGGVGQVRFAAPADGLYLVEVLYGNEWDRGGQEENLRAFPSPEPVVSEEG